MSFLNLVGATVYHCRKIVSRAHFSSPADPGFGLGNLSLAFIHSGNATFAFQGAPMLGKRNDIFCWGKNSPLKEFRIVPGAPFSYTIMRCDVFSAKGGLLAVDPVLPGCLRADNPNDFKKKLEELLRIFQARKPFYLQKCSALVLELLKLLEKGRFAASSAERPQGHLHPKIRMALKFIQENYKKNITLAALTKKVGMNPKYFALLFRKQAGIAPHRYILEYKMNKAKEFIGVFEEGLVNVGEQMGFHDYSHFYRAFKRRTGMTPAGYAKESGARRP